MASNEERTKNMETMYAQTAKVTEVFWEWRHKVMTRFFTTIAGILIIAGWFYKTPELKGCTFVPFFVGACLSVVSHLLDRVNTHVLRDCYRIASDFEGKMVRGGGIFTCIENIHYCRGSYYGVLRFVYLGTAAIFVAIGVTALMVVK